jgi:energy-coupling factor transporter ATP-binding protein EcfA2
MRCSRLRPAEYPASEDYEKEAHQFLQQLAQEGMTMVVVTHEMEFARGVSDRIVRMDKDRIAEQDVRDYMCWVSWNERTRAFLARSNEWGASPSEADSDNPGAGPSLATEKVVHP